MSAERPPRTQHAPRTSQTPAFQPPSGRSQRILACVLCQQRKVKCDRRFPCANCTRNGAQCVPATQARRQRRLFPERELLGRIHEYEDLLRRNNVEYEPLQKGSNAAEIYGGKGTTEDFLESDEEQSQGGAVDRSSPSASVKSESAYDVKSVWQAISQEAEGPKDENKSPKASVAESSVNTAWSQLPFDDHILFGSRQTAADLSPLHPEPINIFRLWQVYLDNVNPLLKVTHTPTLQGRIVEAARDVKSIGPALEALLFGIYSISTNSLGRDECHAMFGVSRKDLLTRYQFGGQQALMNAGFLNSTDRDCLTALYLYLLSLRTGHFQSGCTILGVVMRIAQCMGIHNESSLSKCSVFEAEMRRRLWWSLVLYDASTAERAHYKEALLNPTWDCRVPLNVNDSDLRPEMKEPPSDADTGKATDALFMVVRSKIADCIRYMPSHLEFANPALMPLAKQTSSLIALGKRIERDYLGHCDIENPIHLMTILTARAYIAKSHITEYFSRFAKPKTQTDAQRDDALYLSLRMIDCETKIMKSPLTKNYVWFQKLSFPFPIHMHILHDLRRRPLGKHAKRAWEAIDGNYQVRKPPPGLVLESLLKFFGKTVLWAWEAFEAVSEPRERSDVPKIVLDSKLRESRTAQPPRDDNTQELTGLESTSVGDFLTSMSADFGDDTLMFGLEGPEGVAGMDTMGYSEMPGESLFNFDIDQTDWSEMRGG